MAMTCIVCQFYVKGKQCAKGFNSFKKTSQECVKDGCFVKRSDEDLAKQVVEMKEQKGESE